MNAASTFKLEPADAQRRLAATEELRELCIELRMARLRALHPDWDACTLHRAVLRGFIDYKEAMWRHAR